jgi:5-methylcytosine-specific restriction endonuclease McrA
LPKDEANIDHLIPVSRNGKNTWENMVACDIKINSLKSNKTLEEFEMALIKKPKKPNSHPFIINIEKKNRDWQWFLY